MRTFSIWNLIEIQTRNNAHVLDTGPCQVNQALDVRVKLLLQMIDFVHAMLLFSGIDGVKISGIISDILMKAKYFEQGKLGYQTQRSTQVVINDQTFPASNLYDNMEYLI
jgi:hypothetical protein